MFVRTPLALSPGAAPQPSPTRPPLHHPLPSTRFDLLHIMIDTPDDGADFHVASHIVAVHQRRDAAFTVPYTMAQMQRYIKFARAIKPELTEEVRGGVPLCICSPSVAWSSAPNLWHDARRAWEPLAWGRCVVRRGVG